MYVRTLTLNAVPNKANPEPNPNHNTNANSNANHKGNRNYSNREFEKISIVVHGGESKP